MHEWNRTNEIRREGINEIESNKMVWNRTMWHRILNRIEWKEIQQSKMHSNSIEWIEQNFNNEIDLNGKESNVMG